MWPEREGMTLYGALNVHTPQDMRRRYSHGRDHDPDVSGFIAFMALAGANWWMDRKKARG